MYKSSAVNGGYIMAQSESKIQSLIDRKDCVLLVIDVQEKLIPFIAYKERMIKNIINLIKFSKIIDLPVIMTEQRKLGATIPEIKEELPEIDTYSCFGTSEFVEELKKTGKNTLIITGMETQICVLQTAIEALESTPAYTVHVVSDAISSRVVDNWKLGLIRMLESGVVLSSTEMVIFELLRRANTDEFRATLPLVK